MMWTARTRNTESMTIIDRLRLLLFVCLPQHALSRVVFRLTRIRTPLVRPLMRWFIRAYGVNMDEAAEPDPASYPDFNSFFVRALKPGARPLEGGEDALVSPVDGRISQCGGIDEGRLFQAKGIDYDLARLVGGDSADAEPFRNGCFVNLYLAPGDYHRIHMPRAGRLRRMVHVPGRLYSVAPWTVRTLPGLFTRNERVVALFDTDSGPLAVILVGAINVAAIETIWAGLVTPPRGRGITRVDYSGDAAPAFGRGDEIGRFNMGSTVIVLTATSERWQPELCPGARVQLGQALSLTA